MGHRSVDLWCVAHVAPVPAPSNCDDPRARGPARTRLVLIALLVACGARAHDVRRAPLGDDITLYRDAAVVRQRVVIDVPAASAEVTVQVAAGVAADQVLVLDRGDLTIRAVRGELDPSAETTVGDDEYPPIDDDDVDDPLGTREDPPPIADARRRDAADTTAAAKPAVVHYAVSAPKPGRYTLVLGYTTTRVGWNVAYTIIADGRHERGILRGAVSIDNTTGVVLRAANARLVDTELGSWRGTTAEQLTSALAGGIDAGTSATRPRELGALTLGRGETRVELLAPAQRSLRSVLVYDPIGTRLDNRSAQPLRDPRLGIEVEKSSRVSESVEIARDRERTAGLPAGPVRLFERRADGTLAMLGQARLFEGSDADVDTIAIGTADGVTGGRERRELTIDDENRRIVEEFAITIDNRRARPVGVLVREHLYRGQNWHLAYHSAPAAAKEGPQQIALRVEVPARGTLKILYVVVYTWPS
jgi:hypothetical protein